MNPARYAHDFFYRNHSGKYVCFSFNSNRRIKTKVIEFLKYNHTCEAKLSEYLADKFDLKLEKTHTSRKYLMYDIVDLDLKKLEQECNDYINKINSYNLVQYQFKKIKDKYIIYKNNEEYLEAQSLTQLEDILWIIHCNVYDWWCNLDD